ncbi:MAG: TIGR03768 family metallophosphoesterase [Burkholderiaceae bacterium]|nr:TIGR03768 family metallophosphoesterase [Burkholderiaceae bacterium]
MKPHSDNKKAGLLFSTGLLVFALSGCGGGDNAKDGYPIAADVYTTLQRTVVPDASPTPATPIYPYEVSKYQTNGYGTWQYGSSLPAEKRFDLMPDGYANTAAAVTNVARLLNFFSMTDVHIADKESPAQAIYFGYKGGIISAYSAVMLYTTHVLDAAVQTVNALHKQNPMDFGLSLGDSANNAQYNELRWYIDVFDGRVINPDSGAKDDPVPGPHNDYQDEYQAAGLDKSIPWYQVIGNHDQFWMGSFPIKPAAGKTVDLRPVYTGTDILQMGNIFNLGGINERTYYMGVLDGSTLYGDVIGVGPVASTPEPAKVVADPNRRPVTKKEWMGEFFKTSSNPVGHGFSQANLEQDFASYSFEPKSNLPLKVIVLDDTQKDDDQSLRGYGHGTLDKTRYEWLVGELDKGQAEGKLMIIAAHIPIGVEPAGAVLGWWSGAYISEPDLIAKLNTYPNLILWVAGHRHRNAVKAFKSPDVSRPELGFWQVETSSLREFPQQFRTFEIVRNSDNTISILATNVDPAVKEGSFAAISRSYAVAAMQLFKASLELSPSGSYNAELVKQLSPEMQLKIQNYGVPVAR